MIDLDTKINIKNVRRHYDEKSGIWYFSIVDIIEVVTDSKDPRNYWKVLKNRLKKGQNKLVTQCNQLKLKSSDGKLYLTDVGDSYTILDILNIISPEKKGYFSTWFENFDKDSISKNIELSTEKNTVDQEFAELMIDALETTKHIIIKTFLAGTNPNNIQVLVCSESVEISGERINNKKDPERDYSIEELFWGKFRKVIPLPSLIEIEKVESDFTHGMLIIKLSKLDKNKIRKIKVC